LRQNAAPSAASSAHHATFFLSTGRCGTQWLASSLGKTYADSAVVTHEPVYAAYRPKQFLRSQRTDALLEVEEIRAHVEWIEQLLSSHSYIEAGWPCYPGAPMFLDRFGRRAKFVHLVRNPVPTALSLATHQVYGKDGWVTPAAIDPFDPGVIQKDLGGAWSAMTEYEKCLFWWTEVNLYALEFTREHPEVPVYRVRYEDLFTSPDALTGLLEFLELDAHQFDRGQVSVVVDRFQWKDAAYDWKSIFKYPRTRELAESLGYSLTDVTSSKLSARYFQSWPDSMLALLRRVVPAGLSSPGAPRKHTGVRPRSRQDTPGHA
jgi:hypothetical protein